MIKHQTMLLRELMKPPPPPMERDNKSRFAYCVILSHWTFEAKILMLNHSTSSRETDSYWQHKPGHIVL